MENLQGYIRRFYRQGNELPNVADADVIGAFLSRTTCESLVHKLGCKGPQTTKELLDIATSHASGQEAVGAIFDHLKGKAKWDEDTDEGMSNRPNKKKNKKQHEGSLVAAADRKGGQKPAEGTLDHFEKLLKGPCLNHAFPVKHLYKDCVLMKRFLSRGSNKGDPKLAIDDAEGKDDDFSMLDGCLMIFGGSAAYDSNHRQKLARCEVYTTDPIAPSFL